MHLHGILRKATILAGVLGVIQASRFSPGAGCFGVLPWENGGGWLSYYSSQSFLYLFIIYSTIYCIIYYSYIYIFLYSLSTIYYLLLFIVSIFYSNYSYSGLYIVLYSCLYIVMTLVFTLYYYQAVLSLLSATCSIAGYL